LAAVAVAKATEAIPFFQPSQAQAAAVVAVTQTVLLVVQAVVVDSQVLLVVQIQQTKVMQAATVRQVAVVAVAVLVQ
jgi:hypothetical protein